MNACKRMQGACCGRAEDDLTHKLAEIIKANKKLRQQEESGSPQHIINEFAALLQFHITTYFDNTKPGIPVAQQRSGRCARLVPFQPQCLPLIMTILQLMHSAQPEAC